jgi:hypothetical protein
VAEPIRVEGLKEFSRNLKKLDGDLPKALRIALNEAADIVVSGARSRIPRRTGRASASVKARSTRTASRVVGGSNRVPYYPWLDFGGRVGKGKSVRRPFLKEGRYIYASYFANSDEFAKVLEEALLDVARQAGVEVTDG